MSFQTASAILRGKWLLDKTWAEQHMPLVMRLMRGEKVDFGMQKQSTGLSVVKSAANTVYSVSPYSKFDTVQKGGVAFVSIVGPVMKYGDLCAYGTVEYANLINRIVSSEKFSGIVLNIDGPGGEAYGTAMLADAIKSASNEMPVIGVVDDGMAASADMWIISAADEIYTTKKTDRIGSIGVYTSIADWYSYFESEGLKVRDVYAPQSTEKNKTYKDAIEGNDDLLKADLGVLADSFISAIRENRAGKLTGESWAKGKLFYADEAKNIGLIDGIMPIQSVISRMDELIDNKKSQTGLSLTGSQKSNQMSFERTLQAANAESFQVAEGGFLLTEEQLNAIEASILEAENAASTARTDSETQLQTANDSIAALNDTVDSLTSERDTLQDRVTELEESAPDFKDTSRDADDKPKSKNKFLTSFDKEVIELKELVS